MKKHLILGIIAIFSLLILPIITNAETLESDYFENISVNWRDIFENGQAFDVVVTLKDDLDFKDTKMEVSLSSSDSKNLVTTGNWMVSGCDSEGCGTANVQGTITKGTSVTFIGMINEPIGEREHIFNIYLNDSTKLKQESISLNKDGEIISIAKKDISIPITSIKLNKTNLNLLKGKTEKLSATINPNNTTDAKTLTWTSSNEKIATVDKNGNVKAISAGSATITVKTSNGKTATAKVTVKNPNIPITSIKINQTNPTVVIKKTTKLTATINPSNTTQSKVLTWSSSNKKIATVDKNGVVKGIKAGSANITVKTSNGKTAIVKVTVKKATPIKSVKLNKKTAKLELNKTLQLKATINPSGTTDSKTLTWKSSNTKVASVDKNGKVTAKGAGTATITVKTSNGKTAKCKVTVSKINAKKASIASIANQTRTGKNIKPSLTVKLNGKVLKNGTDYTVTYKNNKNAGKATATVKFKGNYTGSKTATFYIVPSKVDIKNPTVDKTSITVKYSKVSGAKTYQIAYRIKGSSKWSYTTSTSASKKISKLTSGKEYEVMVRAGIKIGSKTIYGPWSNKKSATIKKVVNDSTKEAEARKIAKKIAEVAKTNGKTKLEQVQYAAYLVAQYAWGAEYTNADKDYRTAYGVFIKGVYTCAGTARALGMVMEEMGYEWKHVNANQYTHQWVEITIDGKKVWADAFPTLLIGGKEEMAGYGNYPYA